MRVWLRVGRGWGVLLGFWGTLVYIIGYLMVLAFLAALALAAVIVVGAIAILVALWRGLQALANRR